MAWHLHSQAPLHQCCTSRRSEVASQARCIPAVLVVGTSMVRHVAVHDAQAFCHPAARVTEVTSAALQVSARDPLAGPGGRH